MIEIKRENGEADTIKFSFRYIRLTENQKTEIENELKGAKVEVKSNLSKSNGHVIFVVLDDSVNATAIKKINERLALEKTQFGVWVSLTTHYDHSGFSFPNYIIEFIRTVGGQIDISTIMISESA